MAVNEWLPSEKPPGDGILRLEDEVAYTIWSEVWLVLSRG
jgi:hypothetical protein